MTSVDWVETTGKSVEEATSRALAHLGVHQNDAEVEVLEEPKTGLFGRVKGEARVRARVRPTGPRPKRTRRDRRGSERPDGRPKGDRSRSVSGSDGDGSSPAGSKKAKDSSEKSERPKSEKGKSDKAKPSAKPRPKKSDEKNESVPTERQRSSSRDKSKEEEKMAEGVSLAEQGEFAKEFLAGLLDSLGVEASVTTREIDDETVEVSVNADPPTELGILVGPRGVTLQALQEITRTVVQAKSGGRADRVIVDVAQYRERRVAALGRFAQKVAADVIETGEERALEPMSPADRKAVHDALSTVTDVVTRSEGEEPRRFVVISPA